MIRKLLNFVDFYLKNGFSRSLLILKNKFFQILPIFYNFKNITKFHEKGIKEPFFLRMNTADIGTYIRIFIDKEYNFNVKYPPKVIIDAGANIGLASIYFTNKFPNTKIISLEPEKANFEMLQRNVKSYKNIIPLNAALWCKNEEVELIDAGLGTDGYLTLNQNEINNIYNSNSANESNKDYLHKNYKVPGKTVDKIIEDFNLENLDILKLDIEGSEKELFENSSSWIDKINSIAIELHDFMKPGCSRSFYNGSYGFDNEWADGVSVFISRKDYLSQIKEH